MAVTDRNRLIVLGALLLGAAALNGCMSVNAHFTMHHDGATDALLEVGILKAALEGEGAEGEMNVTEALEEGRWEEPVEFDRGEYRVTSVKGHAGPGERLFKEDTPDVPSFTSETHLLTTLYSFAMPLHIEPPTAEPVAEPPAQPQGEGMEGMGQMFGELAAAMVGEGEAFRFTCALPGRIVTSNGKQVAPGTATWGLSLSGAGLPEGGEMQATSRLVNWQVIGAVGAALVEMGRDDLVLPLVFGAQRGIVPDPATNDPLGGEIDLPLYVQVLDIMVALDALVGEELTDRAMVALKLNADEPDRQAVAIVAGKVAAEDFAATVNQWALDSLVRKLQEP